MTDEDLNVIWFELTGNSEAQLKERSKLYSKGKALKIEGAIVKNSPYLSGGKVIALNPGTTSNFKVFPIAEAHPDFKALNGNVLPPPRGTIAQLLQANGGEKVDVRGVVTALERSRFVMKSSKWEVWVKDDSGKEILLELWGKTFDAECQAISTGNVLQIDNATVKKKDNSAVLTAECYADDPKGGCFLHVNPSGPRTDELKKLGSTSGDRISEAWAGSSGQFAPM